MSVQTLRTANAGFWGVNLRFDPKRKHAFEIEGKGKGKGKETSSRSA